MFDAATTLRSEGRLQPRADRLAVLALLLCGWWLGACIRPVEPGGAEVALRFAEVARLQTHQLNTDLVSVPEGVGLESAGYGWRRHQEPDGSDSWLELTGEAGRFHLFSVDGDLREVELEISRSADDRRNRRPVQVVFNGARIERLRPQPGWSRFVVPVPAHLVQRGANTLDLSWRERQKDPVPGALRIRRLRLRSAGGRPVWPHRPAAIGIGDALELPVASFVDLFVTVRPGARLVGRWQFEARPSGSSPVWAYVELLEESGSRRTLFQKRLYRSARRARQVEVDLTPWQGETVRLRAGVTGGQNGLLRWHDLRLVGTDTDDLALPLPPVERRRPPGSGRLERPDIVLILIDAARADAFSPWGGPHPSPAIERLAAAGTVFAQALSPAPWTGQSVPAILTGLFPDTLGVESWGSRLPEGVRTLPEMATSAGYRTVLWSQHPFYSNHKSSQRGFEEYYRGPRGDYDALPPAEVMVAPDRPTLSLIHLIPPHAPYEPPPPFRGRYSSWYSGDLSVEAEVLNSFPRRRDPAELSEADVRYVKDRYLEHAAYADSLIGRILTRLDGANRFDDALVVVLSDHGEAFLEHGRFLHTSSVHRELLHVPLVFKWPASVTAAAPRVEEVVSLVDLVPTLVDGLGLAGVGDGFQGSSLLPAALDHRPPARPVYALTRGQHDSRRLPMTRLMLETGGWRAIIGPDGLRPRLFRSADDPGETEDLAHRHLLRSLAMEQAALHQWRWNRRLLGRAVEPAGSEELDPETVEQLEALGYLD